MSDSVIQAPSAAPAPHGLAEQYPDFKRAVYEYCLSGPGRIFAKDAMRILGTTSDKHARSFLDAGVQEGWLVSRGRNWGYSVLGLVPRAETLANLVEFAFKHETLEAGAPKGRQRVDGPRKVVGLTQSQLTKVWTAARFVAKHVVGDKHHLEAVGAEHFRWLENGGPNAGGAWELVECVREWAEPLGTATREAHVSAVRNLLDLCATHGQLDRSPSVRPQLLTEAAEWEPWVQEAVRLLAADASRSSRYELEGGARVLARFATRRGWLPGDNVRWGDVAADLLATFDRDAGTLNKHPFRRAQRVYRALQARGVIDAPWMGREIQSDPTILVPTRVALASAHSRDCSAWETRDGRPAIALANGLSRWITWADARLTAADLRTVVPPLPERTRVNPTAAQEQRSLRRMKKGQADFLLCPEILETAVVRIATMAGWASDHDGYDPEHEGLESLIDPERFERRVLAWLHAHNKPDDGRAACLHQLAGLLAGIASPFLQREALLVGDEARAAKYAMWAHALHLREITLEPSEDDRDDAEAKVGVWECDGTSGYQKMERLVDALEATVVSKGGALSIREQIAGIRAGTFHPARKLQWATAVRDAILVNYVRRVPLRARNVVGTRIESFTIRTGDRTRVLAAHWRTSDPDRRPWMGALSVHFERHEMKQRRRYEASYITRGDVGREDAEHGVRRDMLELYLMPSGAREELLRTSDGSLVSSPYLLPLAARTGTRTANGQAAREKSGYRWSPVSASTRFRTLLERHGPAIGLDPRLFRTVHGASGLHVIRHLFGTHWVLLGHLKFASLMLGHLTTHITETIYVGISTVKLSVDEANRSRREVTVEDADPAKISTNAVESKAASSDLASELLQIARLRDEGVIDTVMATAAAAALRAKYGVKEAVVA